MGVFSNLCTGYDVSPSWHRPSCCSIMDEALLSFDIKAEECMVSPIGGGLINDTWKVDCRHSSFVLQRVNHNVFKNPNQIDENLRLIADYMSTYHKGYLFTAPHPNREGQTLVQISNQQYFRLFRFVEESLCYCTVIDSKPAYEAARQFGLFTSKLAAFPMDRLNYTIPDFHNLPLRYESFTTALQSCQYPDRLALASQAVDIVDKHKGLVDIYRTEILGKDQFVKRVCHHDTKISNVLFSPHGHGTSSRILYTLYFSSDKYNLAYICRTGLCVIDLDTVMPGYFISDIGKCNHKLIGTFVTNPCVCEQYSYAPQTLVVVPLGTASYM